MQPHPTGYLTHTLEIEDSIRLKIEVSISYWAKQIYYGEESRLSTLISDWEIDSILSVTQVETVTSVEMNLTSGIKTTKRDISTRLPAAALKAGETFWLNWASKLTVEVENEIIERCAGHFEASLSEPMGA